MVLSKQQQFSLDPGVEKVLGLLHMLLTTAGLCCAILLIAGHHLEVFEIVLMGYFGLDMLMSLYDICLSYIYRNDPKLHEHLFMYRLPGEIIRARFLALLIWFLAILPVIYHRDKHDIG